MGHTPNTRVGSSTDMRWLARAPAALAGRMQRPTREGRGTAGSARSDERTCLAHIPHRDGYPVQTLGVSSKTTSQKLPLKFAPNVPLFAITGVATQAFSLSLFLGKNSKAAAAPKPTAPTPNPTTDQVRAVFASSTR